MLNKKKIYVLLSIVIAVSFIIELLFAHPHYHMIWNTIAGADILIGFLGAWALIILAKKIMAPLLQRRTDYYDNGGDHNDK